ncbi:MAG: hypothetical protein BWY83_00971 [bacterium ADurb.Bin478]|nr:MAG: hypothetical protein BWY83_00971 [bacterium ADurb.Bin478]
MGGEIEGWIVGLKPPAVRGGHLRDQIEIARGDLVSEYFLEHIRLVVLLVGHQAPGEMKIDFVKFADHHVMDLFDKRAKTQIQRPEATGWFVHHVKGAIVIPESRDIVVAQLDAVQFRQGGEQHSVFFLQRIPEECVAGRQRGAGFFHQRRVKGEFVGKTEIL